MNRYIFKHGGKYIALDQASGGYPYETDNPFQAHPFHGIDDAIRYERAFKNKGWTLHKVIGIQLEEVQTDDLMSVDAEIALLQKKRAKILSAGER